MSLSATRLGANAPGLPGPAPLPPLSAALSRRAALFGAVTVAGVSAAAAVPATGQAAALSTNDARLVALADTLARHFDETEAYAAARTPYGWEPDDDPEWDARISAYTPWEEELAETEAASMAGIMAKARALQVPTVRHCQNGIGDSIAADLVRLFDTGASS